MEYDSRYWRVYPMEIKQTIEIEAPIDAVFQFVTSLEKTMEHFPEFKEMHCDQFEKGGTIFATVEVKRIFYKRKLNLKYKIVDIKPPHFLQYKVPSREFTQQITYQLYETKMGTRVEVLNRFTFPNAIFRFYYSLFQGLFEKKTYHVLRKMKQEIEKDINRSKR
jgi:carbon monoxide dehydrogenase subunit G